MSQKQIIDQQLTQQMRLTQQQLRFVRLLELNAPELEEAVEKELEENPALDVADVPAEVREERSLYHDYGVRTVRDDDDLSHPETPDDEVSLYDYLVSQLHLLPVKEKIGKIAEYIIGNIDSNGYLRRSPRMMREDLSVEWGVEASDEEIGEALEVVQHLDPPGVGAQDLRETLLLQLEHLPESGTSRDALLILRDHYDLFAMRHDHKIVSATRLSIARVQEAMDLIRTLNPKPGGSVGSGFSSRAQVMVPDYIVDNDRGTLTIQLDNRIPVLRIEESFEQAMKKMEGHRAGVKERREMEFTRSRYSDARDFIRILSQRQETLFNVMTAIVKLQEEFFLTEDVRHLRPMVMKDVSELTGYDLSVISRSTSNKSVATPWGEVLPLKFFFSDAKGGEGETGTVTGREIETVIRQLVDGEDKRRPLSDDAIQKAMSEKGYDIKRRTVAKYRDRLGIPVARLRKENI